MIYILFFIPGKFKIKDHTLLIISIFSLSVGNNIIGILKLLFTSDAIACLECTFRGGEGKAYWNSLTVL